MGKWCGGEKTRNGSSEEEGMKRIIKLSGKRGHLNTNKGL